MHKYISVFVLLMSVALARSAQGEITVFLSIGDVRPNLQKGARVEPGTVFETRGDGVVVLEESWPSHSDEFALAGECTAWTIISGGARKEIRSQRGSKCRRKDDLDVSIQRAMELQKKVSTVVAFLGAGGKADGAKSKSDYREDLARIASASGASTLQDGLYTVRQKSSNRYLDAYEDEGHDFALVTRPAQTNDTQRWIVKHVHADIYTLQLRGNGRYVDAHEHQTKDWSLVTREPQSNDTQQWIIRRVAGNTYTMQQKSNGRYVDAHETASRDFAVVTRPAQGNDTQRWIFQRQ